jgi:hypothetical protein
MDLAYEDRVIAFVDILGFGTLVESSSGHPAIVASISAALDAVSPENLKGQLFGKLHEEKIPPDLLDEARKVMAHFTEAVLSQHEVRVSYFSDSIVLSAHADNIIATQTVVDLVGRLQTTFWMEHKLLVRGGIAKGELVHIQGGQLFGPAMNCAYHLESKKAVGPRVLMQKDCWAHFEKQPTWHLLAPYFAADAEGARGMSLAECYTQLLVHAPFFVNNEGGWNNLHSSMMEAPADLASVKAGQSEERAIAKYDWLIPRIDAVKSKLANLTYAKVFR